MSSDQKQHAVEIVEKGTDTGVVVFGGLAMGVGVPPFEFARTLERLDCTIVFLRDLDSAWYTQGVAGLSSDLGSLPDAIDDLLQSVGVNHALALGNSSGGFAALHCSLRAEHLSRVLAFAPQSSIAESWRNRWRDRRWSGKIDAIHRAIGPEDPQLDLLQNDADLSTPGSIYFGAFHRLDALHALRLRAMRNWKLNPMMDRSHHPVRRLRDQSILVDVIRQQLEQVGS